MSVTHICSARGTVVLVLVTIAAFVARPAHAAVIMIDFGPTTATGGSLTNSPYHTAGAPFAGEGWNTVGIADVSSLIYSDGTAATGVQLNLGAVSGASATVINLDTQPSSSNALGAATSSGVYTGSSVGKDGIFHGTSGTITRTGVQLTGLPGNIYDVYVTARNTNVGDATASQTIYAGAGADGINFDTASMASATLAYATQTTATSAWVQGENYLKFTVTLTSGQALNIASSGTQGGSANRGFLNSVQIVQIPEPASLGLLAVGGLLLRPRRRA